MLLVHLAEGSYGMTLPGVEPYPLNSAAFRHCSVHHFYSFRFQEELFSLGKSALITRLNPVKLCQLW